jgi:hypothetical protein
MRDFFLGIIVTILLIVFLRHEWLKHMMIKGMSSGTAAAAFPALSSTSAVSSASCCGGCKSKGNGARRGTISPGATSLQTNGGSYYGIPKAPTNQLLYDSYTAVAVPAAQVS